MKDKNFTDKSVSGYFNAARQPGARFAAFITQQNSTPFEEAGALARSRFLQRATFGGETPKSWMPGA